jgi:Tol biopolymer transport system component
VNADGSGQQRLTRNAGYDGDPAWSPDGRRSPSYATGRSPPTDLFEQVAGEI